MNKKSRIVKFSTAMIFGLLICLTNLSVSHSGSYTDSRYRPDTGGGGGGGEIPSPFSYNQKVELADGEYYVLVGQVKILPSKYPLQYRAVFMVDFDQHPWLANYKRVKEPFYPLDGSVDFWRTYEGMDLKFSCKAKAKLINTSGGKGTPRYVITLEALAAPVVFR
ncbi:MAG: hypothetical protein AABZ06_13320 [Bdellovibrionota bacterium]